MIVGASHASPHGKGSGASYVVFGKAGGFAPNIDLSTLDGSNGFQISRITSYNVCYTKLLRPFDEIFVPSIHKAGQIP